MKIAGGSRPADATLGSGLDVTSNEWVRFAKARTVRAGGADPPCNPMPLHFRNRRLDLEMHLHGVMWSSRNTDASDS